MSSFQFSTTNIPCKGFSPPEVTALNALIDEAMNLVSCLYFAKNAVVDQEDRWQALSDIAHLHDRCEAIEHIIWDTWGDGNSLKLDADGNCVSSIVYDAEGLIVPPDHLIGL